MFHPFHPVGNARGAARWWLRIGGQGARVLLAAAGMNTATLASLAAYFVLMIAIGLYAWRREALKRFVSLPPSPLELREKLEELRALENGMRIDIQLVDSVPLGVDTPQDLETARKVLASR